MIRPEHSGKGGAVERVCACKCWIGERCITMAKCSAFSEPFKVCIAVGKTSAPVLIFINKIPKDKYCETLLG